MEKPMETWGDTTRHNFSTLDRIFGNNNLSERIDWFRGWLHDGEKHGVPGCSVPQVEDGETIERKLVFSDFEQSVFAHHLRWDEKHAFSFWNSVRLRSG